MRGNKSKNVLLPGASPGGALPPDFRFCPPPPPPPPDLFLAPHGIFWGERSCCFWPEKTFEFVISASKSLRISAKTFFFFFGDHLILAGKKRLNL